MIKITPKILLNYTSSIIKSLEKRHSTGMSIQWFSEDFGTSVSKKVSSKGTQYRVRGKDWRFTIIINKGEIVIDELIGSHEDIIQIGTLASIM